MHFSSPAGFWRDSKFALRRFRRCLIGASVLSLNLIGPSVAATITGNIDGINASNIGGWACVAGQNQAVSIAIYAGDTLVGTYPTTVQRNDLGNTCGTAPGTYGFSIALSPTIVQQFYGKSSISVQAVADGLTPLLLPPTTSNPYPLPSGSISNATSSGTVTGLVSGTGNAPPVPVLAGQLVCDNLFLSLFCSGLRRFTCHVRNPNSFYASAVLKTPTTYTIPSDAILLGALPLASVDSTPAQQTSFMSFSSASQLGTSTVSLASNECMVALHNVTSPTNALDGVLDFENQSTAYFHSVP